jgi:hypothetical protein
MIFDKEIANSGFQKILEGGDTGNRRVEHRNL